MTESLLSTGLFSLDKELDGGLYPGTLVYLRADSMAMAETFLYQFLQQRPTYYVNTERKPEFIIKNMQRLGLETSDINFINIHHEYQKRDEKLMDYGRDVKDYKILSYLKQQLENIDARDVNLIVDTISFFLHLEVKKAMIRELCDTIYNTIKKMEGLGFLYGVKEETLSLVENQVINLCDAVFEISMTTSGDRTSTRIVVPKARDRPIYGNILKFRVEHGIIIDTTREIA